MLLCRRVDPRLENANIFIMSSSILDAWLSAGAAMLDGVPVHATAGLLRLRSQTQEQPDTPVEVEEPDTQLYGNELLENVDAAATPPRLIDVAAVKRKHLEELVVKDKAEVKRKEEKRKRKDGQTEK